MRKAITKQPPVVERWYRADHDSQTRALMLLVNLPSRDKAAAKCDQHCGGNDGTEIKGDSAYGRGIP